MSNRRSSFTGPLTIAAALVGGVLLASCSLFKYEATTVTPLSIPGAEYVGMEGCAMCHEEEYGNFKLSVHHAVSVQVSGEEGGLAEGCETCHGPGSLHVEDRSDKTKILVGEEELCFSCHRDIGGLFTLQHHHPVPEGRMTCSDCHTMHGEDIKSGRGLSGVTVPADRLTGTPLGGKDEVCFRCHKEMRGPFVFEHDAMREGCASCHNPHGAVMDKMLVAGQTTLCLRCHWDVSFNNAPAGSPAIGGIYHSDYFIGQGEECIDHHRATHGSNIWRTLNR